MPRRDTLPQPALCVFGPSWWQRMSYSGNGVKGIVFLGIAL